MPFADIGCALAGVKTPGYRPPLNLKAWADNRWYVVTTIDARIYAELPRLNIPTCCRQLRCPLKLGQSRRGNGRLSSDRFQ